MQIFYPNIPNFIKPNKQKADLNKTNQNYKNSTSLPGFKHNPLFFGMAKISSEGKKYLNQLNTAIIKKRLKTATEIIQGFSELAKPIQIQIALSTNYLGNTIFNNALEKKQPEIAKKFFEFVMKIDDKETHKDFALIVNKKIDTQFNVAIINEQPVIAKEFLDFVMKLDDEETQKEFALSVNNLSNTQFNVAVMNEQPVIAKEFLEFVMNLDDEETQNKFALSTNNLSNTHIRILPSLWNI